MAVGKTKKTRYTLAVSTLDPKTILATLRIDDLRRLAQTHQIPIKDHHKREDYEEALVILPIFELLAVTSDSDLRLICTRSSLSPTGSRTVLLARLVGAQTLTDRPEPRSAPTPLPDGAPAGLFANPMLQDPPPSPTSTRPARKATRKAPRPPPGTHEIAPALFAAARPRAPFVAIDFETADRGRDSACAIGLIRVENGQIIDRMVRLIRPPRRMFEFTYIHGITWPMVANEPDFPTLWPAIEKFCAGISFFAAHNAPFDQGVLETCCLQHEILPPSVPFVDTVYVARKKWNIYPTKLPNVCSFLNLELNHHEAGSDAEACARIVIAAEADRI